MRKICFIIVVNLSMLLPALHADAQSTFVSVKNHQFFLNGQPYYYTGANYWYGGLLGLQSDSKRGIERLRHELDFLKSKGISNLRVLGTVEGSGQIQSVQRVQPALQTTRGSFDTSVLKGLDLLLTEMGKRNMKAVIYLGNNWEWTGGFLQYLNWNGQLTDSLLAQKLSWDDMRDAVSGFYSCAACIDDYLKQVQLVVNRVNSITGKKYSNDPAIMSWELVNEPRPMRPAAADAYLSWVSKTSAYIKNLDNNHLVTSGSEGEMGIESMELFKATHAFKTIDYLTIHIWPKNWGWFKPETMDADLPLVIDKATAYISKHDSVARLLNKPLVIEEFGLPRDGHSFSPAATTILRDTYFKTIFDITKRSADQKGVIGGFNFWAFAGMARAIDGQVYWKQSDDYLGDPPMEEQGLNSVFDSDASTWKIISAAKPATVSHQ